MFFDAHFHLIDCITRNCFSFDKNWNGCASFCSKDEFNFHKSLLTPDCSGGEASAFGTAGYQATKSRFLEGFGSNLKISFGIHPLILNMNEADFLQKIVEEKQIDAIGEAGFDFFTKNAKATEDFQIKAWEFQLDLAINHNLPLIVHCRKANHKLFEYSKKLKNVKAVLFHSFMGTSTEALSLKSRGINAFFSFGKQILNNNKKVLDCAKNLPLDCLLWETDAPYQTLKNQQNTFSTEIFDVYKAAWNLRSDEVDFDNFVNLAEKNFKRIFD